MLAAARLLPVFMVVCATLALSACGFTPLYGPQNTTQANTPVASELASIRILPIANRLGQQMHNDLRNELNPTGQPANQKYNLQILMDVVEQDLGTRADETASRANIIVNAVFTLVDIKTGKVLVNARAKSIASQNILESGYTNYVSREDAVSRNVQSLAREIRDRLAGYMTRTLTPQEAARPAREKVSATRAPAFMPY